CPEADVLDIGPRRSRGRRRVRVEDRELVALVLEEPVLGLGLELEAVRARRGVVARDVALCDTVAQGDQATGLVRGLRLRVAAQLGPDLRRDHHQTAASSSSSAADSQKPAERYFQPASASTATIVPSSSSAASFRATWMTAPDETPAKTPSARSSSRREATASSFETSTFRSSCETSRTGGT